MGSFTEIMDPKFERETYWRKYLVSIWQIERERKRDWELLRYIGSIARDHMALSLHVWIYMTRTPRGAISRPPDGGTKPLPRETPRPIVFHLMSFCSYVLLVTHARLPTRGAAKNYRNNVTNDLVDYPLGKIFRSKIKWFFFLSIEFNSNIFE